MRQRASAVIIKDNRILLMHRIKPGEDYYVFPGGGVEDGESIEQAAIREVREELSLDASGAKELFTVILEHQIDHYCVITEWSGEVALGSDELRKNSPENRYEPTWLDAKSFFELKDDLYIEAQAKLKELQILQA